ncbi:enoyl-CoA hydratase-related protein [Nocardioides sp. TF02-7]|uniref:enoyl-CoA hydratase-related protein n=1 Tax=Nocardioides sp. TF02-7 TaxID=2917724 RepID=UPI001F0512BD|nr:enoyl-CoA hydratase-related protein [Nocardioides sp. TF02-7]UMG91590.1 enoyl-CoA hydratase-related protein [Nocardioides sp. TF02-7]
MTGVQLSIAGSVAIVTLDDPDRRNVLSPELVAGLAAAFDEAEADERVRAAVVAAEGRAFCAGAELDTLLRAADGDFGPVEAVYDGFLRVLHSPLLTIGAVGGPAVGAGMNLALACDLRIAGPRASFDTRFAQLRLHPGGGHMYLLQRAVGYQQAAAACLLSQTWSAEDARRVGFVLDVVEGDLVEAAVRVASGLDGLDADLARRMVASFRTSATLTQHREALALETEAQRWSTTLPGFVAGVAAIKERIARG